MSYAYVLTCSPNQMFACVYDLQECMPRRARRSTVFAGMCMCVPISAVKIIRV